MRGPGVNSAVVAIAIVYLPVFARVMRGPVLAEREKEYVGGDPRPRRHAAGGGV